ncbi:MAG TPA: HNH endonuclease signature motif containing protein [Burkholderiales bacterium]|nr:HNH endonuclease signature motif containing protein [Burkholderiales bacterium]
MAKNWTEQEKINVWNKGAIVAGYDSTKYRKDQCDAWMIYNEYGNRSSVFGWEIDHISPNSSGGADTLSNLRPLQWQNNVDKSDGRLKCNVSASGNQNVDKLRRL